MYPVLINLGPIPLHSYGFMIAIGFLIAVHFIQRESKRAGIDEEVIGNAAFWSLLIGIAGARIFHILMYSSAYSWSDPLGWIAIWRGGLVFQGAPIAVTLFLIFYFRKHKISFTKVADIALPYIAMAHGMGRIGCFMYGCCYGKKTDSFLGVCFPRVPFDAELTPTGSPALLDQIAPTLPHPPALPYEAMWSLPVHPTQLYSSAGLFIIFALLLWIRRHWRSFDGIMLPLYLILYGTFRFSVEFFRGDANPTHFSQLSDQQVISAVSIVLGIALFFIMKRYAPRSASKAEA